MLPTECVQSQQCVELYLLETMSFGGNSGSPVFFSLGIDRESLGIDRELGKIYPGWEMILASVMRGSFKPI